MNFWWYKKDGNGLRGFHINKKFQSGKASAMQPPIVYNALYKVRFNALYTLLCIVRIINERTK